MAAPQSGSRVVIDKDNSVKNTRQGQHLIFVNTTGASLNLVILDSEDEAQQLSALLWVRAQLQPNPLPGHLQAQLPDVTLVLLVH